MSGKKRASPGADDEKSPLANVELSDNDAKKLDDVQKHMSKVALALDKQAQKRMDEVYVKRREVAKTIPKYWPVALMNNPSFAYHAQHKQDQYALTYLEDIWVVRDSREHRCFIIEFHFKENPYFSDSVLKKEFKYILPPGAEDETADEDGIYPSSLDFSWTRDVDITGGPIEWKSPEKTLTKQFPRVPDPDDPDTPQESGSFFNWFEYKDDPYDIGVLIATEIFPEATDYFLGNAGGDELDSEDDEDSDNEDDEDEADEIDLEKPKSKKQKHA